jgi:peroxiredoxin
MSSRECSSYTRSAVWPLLLRPQSSKGYPMKYFLILLLASFSMGFAGDFKSLAIGDAVPAFTLKSFDGKEYNLQKVLKDNKLTVVMFISTQCPVSNAYNERMEKLSETYNKKGVVFIGINSNKEETVEGIAQHAKEHGFQFPVLKDAGNKVADLYAAQVTPETFVISGQGKLLYHGRIDDNRNPAKVTSADLSNALSQLLDGKELTITTVKAFGCSIKRVE